MKQITLKSKEIKKIIADSFGPIVAADGFEYKSKNNEFICKKGSFTYIFNLMVTSWSTGYSVDLKLWIRQDDIENIYKAVLGKSFGLTMTQNMLERIYYSPDGRQNGKGQLLTIDLQTDEEVYAVSEQLKEYYIKIAKPYFKKFDTLEAFDDFINNAPFEYSPAYAGMNTNERYMKGLIVAKLVNNPNYNKLVSIYDELIKRTVSDVQPDSEINYNKVKDYLDTL